jgi:hypothetical protein
MVKSSMFASIFALKQLAMLTAFQVPFLGSIHAGTKAEQAGQPVVPVCGARSGRRSSLLAELRRQYWSQLFEVDQILLCPVLQLPAHWSHRSVSESWR